MGLTHANLPPPEPTLEGAGTVMEIYFYITCVFWRVVRKKKLPVNKPVSLIILKKKLMTLTLI